MQRATLWLVLLLLPHWGDAQNQTDNTCPKRCVCQSLSETDPEYRVECKILPDSHLPLRTTEFKSIGFPSKLNSEIFQRLKPFFVKTLDLSHGSIIYVENFGLYELNKATLIDLSHNRIQNMGKYTLRGCDSLEEIRLSYNHITKLEEDIFTDLFSLKTIYLDNNQIATLSFFIPSCRELDASNNIITSSIYIQAKHLESLNLCGNPIDVNYFSVQFDAVFICSPIPLKNSNNQKLIESLRLEYHPNSNPITKNLQSLAKTENLKELKIIGFQMKEFIWPAGVGHKIIHLALNHVLLDKGIEEQFLDSLRRTSVKSLDLSNSSQLARILLNNHTIWDDLSDLEFLDLRSCNLISLEQLRANRRQISIDAGKNPMHCDCELAKQLKVGRIRLVGNETLCATPDKYAGQAWLPVLRKMCPTEEFLQDKEYTVPSEEFEETTPEIAEKRIEADEAEKISPDESKTNQTPYVIMGVILALMFNNILIFSVQFFYFGLRRPNRIENGTALYNIETSGRDSPSVNPLL